MKRTLVSLLSVLILSLFVSAPASAVLKIDITKGNIDPTPIAIPNLAATNGASTQIGADIARVVSSDLESSGFFRPISPNAFIERIDANTTIPRFPDWRQINSDALVTGTVTVNGDKMRVAFRLWDINSEQQIAGKEFNTFTSNWRRVSHIIADEIYKRLTGEDGYFDTRIVYVAESGPGNARVKRLAIMDQDGENHKFLTDGRYLALTPRFSPNSQEIIYMSYAGNAPKVYLRDLQTGREESLGRFKGMSFAPRFTPNGRGIIMSIAENGVTNLYTMDLGDRQLRRITDSRGIDTSPSYSPEGDRIVFNSDRGGSQQLYTMSSYGGNVQRISFGEGNYGTPVWSPRGDLIAFTKIHRGKFYIGVMRPDGSGERMVTESWLDEGPTWAPNGRVLMFTRQYPSSGGRPGTSRVYSVDITGYNLRERTTPMDASDPAWSPLLPL